MRGAHADGAGAGVTTPTLSPSLVHDYLLVMRGAERTFAAIADCFPSAPIHTLLYDPEGTGHRFAGRDVRTSRLQRLRIRQTGFRRLLPLFPFAAEHLEIEPSDLVISSSSAFAHGVRTDNGTVHIAYCHSPIRYAWHERAIAAREVPGLLRPATLRVINSIRR